MLQLEKVVEQFTKHISRSRFSPQVRTTWNLLKESVSAQRTSPVTLAKFVRHISLMLKQSHNGKLESTLLESLLSMGSLRGLAGGVIESLDPHTSFLSEMGRQFKVRAELTEAVSSGLHLYLNEADTKKLLGHNQTRVESVVMSRGYHCVRRGTMEDLDHGHSGQRVSKWVFIKL